ncbi:MAG: hypothetical protein ACRD8O_05380 [Bryobacteraceae bacterium]
MPKRILAFVFALAPMFAQSHGAVGGPSLGWVFDSAAGQFRAVLGIPGASILGDPAPLDARIRRAAILPGQDYALISVEGGPASLADLRSGAMRPIPGAIEDADRILLSPSGTAAILISTRAGRAQALSGLPAGPAVRRELDASGLLAISDSGDLVLAARDGALDLLSTDAAPKRLIVLEQISAAAFFDGSSDIAVADRARREVYLIRHGEIRMIASSGDGLGEPLSLAASKGRIVAGFGKSVALIDPAGAPPVLFECACPVDSLAALDGANVFGLHAASFEEPLWLLEAAPAAPRIVFVPAAVERSAQ